MKYPAYLMIVFSLACFGCEQGKKYDGEKVEHTENHASVEDAEHETLWEDEIVLNSGVKWGANPETTEGVIAMSTLIENHHGNTLEDYHKLAASLNEEKNLLIKKCTMEGPSHDNLHIFLLPLIGKIGALEKVVSAEEGAKIKVDIDGHLAAYHNYFQ